MDLWAAFALGLVGSLHCAGMCGPLALALPMTQGGGGRFAGGRALYNLGRVTTYAVLGLVFGSIGKALVLAGLQQALSIGLGLALLGGLILSRRLALATPLTRALGGLRSGMAKFLTRRTLGALAVLGLLNGLLPCGLVYVACAGAAATGGPVTGGLYMAVFGLGTVPVMLAIGLSGQLVQVALRRRLLALVPVSVCLLAALLILRGMGLGIPYLSPNLGSAGGPDCCHPEPASTK